MNALYLAILLLVNSAAIASTTLAQVDLTKTFGGVGIILSRHSSGYARIDETAPDGPAAKAGLKRGERLFSVNDSLVYTRSLAAVTALLKGNIGSTVKVGIIRGDSIVKVHLVRAAITPWREEACISGDCKNGPGKLVRINGDTIAGAFIDGLAEGDVAQTHPDGECLTRKYSRGKPVNDSAVIRYPDGKSYVGMTREGVAHGVGTMTFPDGTIRSGLWIFGRFISGCYKGNCQNGQGTMVIDFGRIYEGTFKNGEFEGLGTVTFPDSAGEEIRQITCPFSRNCPSGPGLVLYRNGDRYDGELQSIQPSTHRTGKGTMYYANGDVYEGSWENCLYQGTGLLRKKDGTRHVGTFSRGKMHGWMATVKDSTLSLRIYDNGKIDKAKQKDVDEYFKKNRLHEKTNLLLQQYALLREIFDQGCLYGNCQNGVGLSWGIPTSDVVYYGAFKDGKPNGAGEMYMVEGKETFRGNFKNGLRHGMMEILAAGFLCLPRIYYEGKAEAVGWSSMEQFEAKLAKELDEAKKELALKDGRAGFISPVENADERKPLRYDYVKGEHTRDPRFYTCTRCEGMGTINRCYHEYDMVEEKTYSSYHHSQSNLVKTERFWDSRLICKDFTCEWCHGTGKLEY